MNSSQSPWWISFYSLTYPLSYQENKKLKTFANRYHKADGASHWKRTVQAAVRALWVYFSFSHSHAFCKSTSHVVRKRCPLGSHIAGEEQSAEGGIAAGVYANSAGIRAISRQSWQQKPMHPRIHCERCEGVTFLWPAAKDKVISRDGCDGGREAAKYN